MFYRTLKYSFYREGRSSSLQSSDCKQIGDILLRTFDVLLMEHYLKYLDAHARILQLLEDALDPENGAHAGFRQLFTEFEAQKVCYLPVTTLLLKPLHRVLHYELLLEREFVYLDINIPLGVC